ncbi:MAG: ATP-binding protein [Desulfovibrio sp.]|nr:ATP-binding protein [Desulfovibrio sp.]
MNATRPNAIPAEQVLLRLKLENPWWEHGKGISSQYRNLPHRQYFDRFHDLVADFGLRRAVILMGPRRVGKTVLLQQTIQKLLDIGNDPKQILFASVDVPTYTGLSLDEYLSIVARGMHFDVNSRGYVFFDEIQYLKDWERHLKVLVDTYPQIKFVASGSAAAALRLKSTESGAGRFTDFLLPPLTFFEYLRFMKRPLDGYYEGDTPNTSAMMRDIAILNTDFIDYINFGGYPEAVFSETIKSDPGQFIRRDIIDKVLLRDLPSLYGISDIQELNRLFTMLAFQSGQELSLDGLAQSSGVAKSTIKRYIEYLEAAFLIIKLRRIDDNCKKFQRERTFKIYLANPSMRAALFSPILDPDDSQLPHLVETAIVSQLTHIPEILDLHYYARWKDGEIDIVKMDSATFKPSYAVEIKWTDRYVSHHEELNNIRLFLKKMGPVDMTVTTKTIFETKHIPEKISYIPSSVFCLIMGNIYSNASTSISF